MSTFLIAGSIGTAMFASSSRTVLLVDGYNIIGDWPQLRKLAKQSAMAIARIHLIEMLSNLVAFRDYQATVVFDAYTQPIPARTETSPTGIEIVYTSYGETADTFIERTCAQLQWEECRVRVATSDRTQQLVVGGYDADWLTAQQLLEEVNHTLQQIRKIKHKPTKSGRGIDRYLDPSTRERLAHWRINGTDPVT